MNNKTHKPRQFYLDDNTCRLIEEITKLNHNLNTKSLVVNRAIKHYYAYISQLKIDYKYDDEIASHKKLLSRDKEEWISIYKGETNDKV